MSVIATWGPKKFEVSDKTINTFNGFSASRQLASDEQRDDGGNPSTNVKGADLRDMSFQIALNSSLGISAQSEIDSWDALLEKADAYSFDIGGTPWGDGVKFQLKGWSLSEVDFTKKGSFFVVDRCMLSLTFKEWQAQASAQKKSSVNKASKDTAPSKKEKAAAATSNPAMLEATTDSYTVDDVKTKGDASLAKE